MQASSTTRQAGAGASATAQSMHPLDRYSVHQLLLLLIGAIIVPMTALLILQIVTNARSDIAHAEQLVQGLARVTADETGTSLRTIMQSVQLLSARASVRNLDPDHCDPVIQGLAMFKPNVANVATVDRAGTIVCSSTPNARDKRPAVSGLAWFRQITENNVLTIGEPHRGVISRRWVVPVAAPLLSSQGAFNGAIAITIDLVKFQPIIKAVLPPGGVAGIINRNGIVVARSERAEELIGRDIRSTNTGKSMLRSKASTEVTVGNDGVERFYAYQPVDDTPWLVAVGIPTSEVYADARSNILRSSAGALAVLALAILFVSMLCKRITIPLSGLGQVARLVGTGIVDRRVPVAGPPEVRQVATSFNHMLDRLPVVESELRTSEEEYRRLFMAAPSAIRVVCDGEVVMANPAAVALFGSDPDGTATGLPVVDTIAPAYREQARERIRFVIDQQKEYSTDDLEFQRADGTLVPASLVLIPFQYRGRRSVISIVNDRSSERALAHSLEERRREMQRLANLLVAKQSVSAIAHELNQPLVAISAYSEAALAMARRDLGQPAKMLQALEGAAAQAQRAGQTLHALMTFLEKGDTSAQALDLNRLISAFVERRDEENPASIRIELDLAPELPLIKANHLQLELILSNLIQNAGESIQSLDASVASGRISIVTRRVQDAVQVSVRDNGIGIPATTADGIFDPFSTTKSTGLGLGLTISKALAESMGGRLWHDTACTSGALFHLSIPVAT